MAKPLSGVPLTITARLQQGAALDSRFGVALDGLLSSQIRAAMQRWLAPETDDVLPGSLLDGGLNHADPVDVDLPLGMCRRTSDWHWMATTAQPIDHDGQPVVPDLDVHHVNSTTDHKIAEVVALRLPPTLSSTSGRYRTRRLPVVTFPAAALRWRAVGDPEAVESLLSPLMTVGARRGGGEGAVVAWTVDIVSDGDRDAFGHLHADGTLGRPVPTACAARLTVAGVGEGVAGLRPPYWHPARQHLLVLPGYAQSREAT